MELSQLDFESKIRSKRNLREFFAIKKNLYFPKESCFNTTFIIKVFKNEKKLLSLNETKPPELHRIKDASLFDKKALFSIIKNDSNLNKYIPDDCNAERLNRDYMAAIIFYKDRSRFNKLYDKYVNLKRGKGESKVANKLLTISTEYAEEFKSYIPSSIEARRKVFLKNTNQNSRTNAVEVINNNNLQLNSDYQNMNYDGRLNENLGLIDNSNSNMDMNDINPLDRSFMNSGSKRILKFTNKK
jgi:hypothetical protein